MSDGWFGNLLSKANMIGEKAVDFVRPLDAGAKDGTRAHKLIRFGLKCSHPSFYLSRHFEKSKKKGWARFSDSLGNFCKETVFEDAPITADVYGAGKSDGKREGYSLAAKVFGAEIRRLANKLVELKRESKQLTERQKTDYERIIDLYDAELEKLNARCDRSEDENAYLRQLLEERKSLERYRE